MAQQEFAERLTGVCPLIIHPRNTNFSVGVKERTWKRETNRLAGMWSPGFETVNPGETHRQAIERYLEEELVVMQGRIILPPVLERSIIAKVQLASSAWLYVYPCLGSEDLRVNIGFQKEEVGPPVWMHTATVLETHRNGNGFSFRPGTGEIYESYLAWRRDPLGHTTRVYENVVHSVPSQVFDLLESGVSQTEALNRLGLEPQKVLTPRQVGLWSIEP